MSRGWSTASPSSASIEAQTDTERAAENLRKFLLAMSDDIRVLLVKLADRLHNMRTLHFIKNPDKRRRIARETMDIYAPLAERIGMYDFMDEMQELAFRQLEPEAYATITKRLEQLRAGGGDVVKRISSGIRMLLARPGIEAEVSGREKQPYSIWRKMSAATSASSSCPTSWRSALIVDDPAATATARWACSTGAGRWCRGASRTSSRRPSATAIARCTPR